jgi:hypothetical protein
VARELGLDEYVMTLSRFAVSKRRFNRMAADALDAKRLRLPAQLDPLASIRGQGG